MPNFLTVEEVAALLGYKNPETIRRMVRRGDITARKVKGSKAWRFTHNDVQKAIEKVAIKNTKPNNPT